MKIDLQELKRLAGYDTLVLLDAAPLKALVDVVEKALTFDAKLIECEPHISDAFAFRHFRLGPYKGPNYAEELTAFRAALTHFTESTNEEA